MQYEEWLNTLDSINNSSTNLEILKKLQNTEVNISFNDYLIPKIEDLIKNKFNTSINKIIKDLENIYTDINYLDLSLLNFKKEINYILELSKLKQLPQEKQQELINMIKEETTKVYDILCKEADKIDYTGATSIVIKNNRIKWSD